MDYSYKFFRDSMPEWKRKKDAMVVRFFYRPISFFVASLCAKCGISANAVSYFSIIIALLGCVCFLFDNHIFHIVGAVMFNLWLLLDCVDGNLARSVKKQAFGEFADATSSYILVAFMCTSMAFAVYFEGGLLVGSECVWVILAGALASTSDTLMRLIYQKYSAEERELVAKGLLDKGTDEMQDHGRVASLSVWMAETMGVGGVLPLLILIAVLFHSLDLILIYCTLYYCGSAFLMILKHIRKAIVKSKNINLEK